MGERETFGIPGHCDSIDGEWWHEPGECTAPECRRKPCCGYVERRSGVERRVRSGEMWDRKTRGLRPRRTDRRRAPEPRATTRGDETE